MGNADSGRYRGRKFRELTALVLRAHGVIGKDDDEVTARVDKNLLPSAYFSLTEEPARSDVAGLERWSLLTRDVVTRDISGALDRAVANADADEREFAAVVFSRAGRRPEDAYAVMSLGQLANLIRETEPVPS